MVQKPDQKFVCDFQLKCKAFKSSKFNCYSLESSSQIFVDVANIQFSESVWSAVGVNLKFTSCDIKLVNISFIGIKPNSYVHLCVTDCQIGSNLLLYHANATFTDCHLLNETIVGNESTLVSAYHSEVIIKTSHFENIIGRAFLQVTSGTVQIHGTTFLNCVAAVSLINVASASQIHLENCTFTSCNSMLVLLTNISQGFIKNSKFESSRNVQSLLSFLVGFPLIQAVHSYLEVKHCHYLNNTFLAGANIDIRNGSVGIVEDSTFASNTAVVGSTIVVANAIAKVGSSTFSNNKGGAMEIYNGSFIAISGSLFDNNSAQEGGGIYFFSFQTEHTNEVDSKIQMIARQHNPDMHIIKDFVENEFRPEAQISNCTFADNSAERGGAIHATHVSLTLVNNYFVNNSAKTANLNNGGFGGAVLHTSASNSGHVLHISNSSFEENVASEFGGAIYSASQTVVQTSSFIRNTADGGGGGGLIGSAGLSIKRCQFAFNSAMIGGALFSVGSHASITQTHFSHNSAASGGAVSGGGNISLTCISCIFHNNTAMLG